MAVPTGKSGLRVRYGAAITSSRMWSSLLTVNWWPHASKLWPNWLLVERYSNCPVSGRKRTMRRAGLSTGESARPA